MESELDDWIYWHFFTITINYDYSQSVTAQDSPHSLLDYECLLFYCEERRITPELVLVTAFNDNCLTNAALSALTYPPFYSFGRTE
jgi:hypothetical protein